MGATSCASGYRTGSYLCSACDARFYEADDGTCVACPAIVVPWVQYQGLIVLLIVLIVAVAVVYVTLLGIVRCAGGSVQGGAKRALDFGIWTLLAVQTVAQVR